MVSHNNNKTSRQNEREDTAAAGIGTPMNNDLYSFEAILQQEPFA